MAEIEIVVTQTRNEKARVYILPFAIDETVACALDRLAQRINSDVVSSGSVIAIHGKVVDADTKLQIGDRLEVLRPLVIDPKDARRQRAHSGRKKRLNKPHSSTSSSVMESESE